MSEGRSSDPGSAVEMSTSEGYDRWSEIYDTEDNPLVILETDHFYPLLGDVQGLEILDVGCGTGRHSARLDQSGARVTGVDFSEGMLSKAQAKAPRVDFQQQDIQQPLRFADDRFDRVICGLVLDHVHKLRELFGEMGRVCRPDGSIVVSVMHPAMMLAGARALHRSPDRFGDLSGERSQPGVRLRRGGLGREAAHRAHQRALGGRIPHRSLPARGTLSWVAAAALVEAQALSARVAMVVGEKTFSKVAESVQ